MCSKRKGRGTEDTAEPQNGTSSTQAQVGRSRRRGLDKSWAGLRTCASSRRSGSASDEEPIFGRLRSKLARDEGALGLCLSANAPGRFRYWGICSGGQPPALTHPRLDRHVQVLNFTLGGLSLWSCASPVLTPTLSIYLAWPPRSPVAADRQAPKAAAVTRGTARCNHLGSIVATFYCVRRTMGHIYIAHKGSGCSYIRLWDHRLSYTWMSMI